MLFMPISSIQLFSVNFTHDLLSRMGSPIESIWISESSVVKLRRLPGLLGEQACSRSF